MVKEYLLDGSIVFEDGTQLDNIDTVIYCTGYSASFPFWNATANGRPLWDYETGKLGNIYWHTFFQDFPTLGIVGMPRVLTFRSFEYQAIALARLFSDRNSLTLPPVEVQRRWEVEWAEKARKKGTKFHDISWDDGETVLWLDGLFRIAGLGTLTGKGRVPPVLDEELIWAVEHVKKYPLPGDSKEDNESQETEWASAKKDTLAFI